MDREAWCAVIHEVVKSQTWLNDWTELNWTDVLDSTLKLHIKIDAFKLVLEMTLQSPLDSKEINQLIPKKINSIFIRKIDAEPDAKSQLFGKDPDAGKDWGQEEKGTTEGEMVGWHHWLTGHEFEQTPRDGEEQGSLEHCSSWGHKEFDTT